MKKMDIVAQYLERFPDLPSLTLARKIYNDEPNAFPTLDAARSSVRRMRGAIGGVERGNVSDRRFLRDLQKPYNPYGLPVSDEKEFAPVIIPPGNSQLLVLSDVHIPFHSVAALTAVIEWGLKKDIKGILLNGDILDFYQLSRFEKDPRSRSFADELQMAEEFIETLRHAFPGAPIWYKEGNHELRWERFLKTKAPELLDCDDFRLDVLLKCGQYGVQYVREKRVIKAGRLSIVHGHEFFGGSGGVNPARWLFLRSGANAMCGHFHKTSEHTEPDIDGNLQACWSTGCLSELHPDYAALNKWNQGFARIVFDEDRFRVDNIRIDNGKVL